MPLVQAIMNTLSIKQKDFRKMKTALQLMTAIMNTTEETVLSVAGKFDGRALSFDSPVVVSKDGVVLSGNNRTMSSKLAAQKGTD